MPSNPPNVSFRCSLASFVIPDPGISPSEVQAHSIGALLVEAITAGTAKQQTRRAGGGNLAEVIASFPRRDGDNKGSYYVMSAMR